MKKRRTGTVISPSSASFANLTRREEAMTVRKVAVQLTLLICLCMSGAAARSHDRRDFWALNNTGKEIREFYVSAHESTNWGNDVLGRSTLLASAETPDCNVRDVGDRDAIRHSAGLSHEAVARCDSWLFEDELRTVSGSYPH
jgi:hypothetical protein